MALWHYVLIEGYMHMCFQGFHLHAQSVPPAIFNNIKVLTLKCVTVDSGVLSNMLSHCHQLGELQLLRTLVEGTSLQLPVLSKLPSLSMILDLVHEPTPSSATARQRLACLQDLGSCLTSLIVATRDVIATGEGFHTLGTNPELQRTVFRAATTHLPGLKHLTVAGSSRSKPDRELLLGLAMSPSAQQLETLTLNGLELPDMECVVKLLCMSKLRLLAGVLNFPEYADDMPASLSMPWPKGKPPMELDIGRAHVRQLAALPVEHFSRISIHLLDLAVKDASRGPTQEQHEQRMHALVAAAHKCPEFVIGGIGAYTHSVQNLGLPGLGPGCPIELADTSSFVCVGVALQAADIQGVAAAWGPQLKELYFGHAVLGASAWAAITPTAFPLLERIEYAAQIEFDWVSAVAALCIEWPADRTLSIAVDHSTSTAQDAAAEFFAGQLRQMLEVRGRQNITLTFGDVYERE
jgi:hypothetical protein